MRYRGIVDGIIWRVDIQDRGSVYDNLPPTFFPYIENGVFQFFTFLSYFYAFFNVFLLKICYFLSFFSVFCRFLQNQGMGNGLF